MFGTPAYTPPEVFAGRPYGREVDIWAFGVMLYELITGRVCLCPLICVLVTDFPLRKHLSRLQFLRMIRIGSFTSLDTSCTTNWKPAPTSHQILLTSLPRQVL